MLGSQMRSRLLSNHSRSLLVALFLCASVVLQILGAPVSFCDLNEADNHWQSDLFEENLSITTDSEIPVPFWSTSVASVISDTISASPVNFVIFHPPIFSL
jgi:hypothetical protein